MAKMENKTGSLLTLKKEKKMIVSVPAGLTMLTWGINCEDLGPRVIFKM